MPTAFTPEQAADASTSELSSGTARLPPIDKIVVAIHGIGNQRRSETIRSTARRFCARNEPPLPVMPLGFFNIGGVGEVCVSRLDVPNDDHPLARLGFAEVYWADIPREVVKRDDTLEESRAWGETIVGRARVLYQGVERANQGRQRLKDEDFSMAAGVIEEIVESVGVLENLLVVTKKAGIFNFDLAPLLRDYIGDVQLVAEFQFYRNEIVYRFHTAMQAILERFRHEYPHCERNPEIYIVAHSEGTVIAFLALLQALSWSSVTGPDGKSSLSTSWIESVRGFMTLGSPIDKHILLWPKLWEGMNLASRIASDPERAGKIEMCGGGRDPLTLSQPIKWRNYYDFGDPVGFKLDTAREYLEEQQCRAFDFSAAEDFGFSRYWLPGKAHVDYWNDDEVFGHFIQTVVWCDDAEHLLRDSEKYAEPRSKPFVGTISTAIPYLLSYVLHVLGVFLLFKAVMASVDLSPYPYPNVTGSVFVLSLLLMAVTASGRLPRLVRRQDRGWPLLAFAIFLCGALPCLFFLPPSVSQFLDGALLKHVKLDPAQADFISNATLVFAAALVSLAGWFAPRKPRRGRRYLVGAGTLMLSVAIVYRLYETSATTAIWPLFLAALMFLYLWLLGVMVFDLAFIWHRYIRFSISLEAMRAWRQNRDYGEPPPDLPPGADARATRHESA